jgi:hypothetical protein
MILSLGLFNTNILLDRSYWTDGSHIQCNIFFYNKDLQRLKYNVISYYIIFFFGYWYTSNISF